MKSKSYSWSAQLGACALVMAAPQVHAATLIDTQTPTGGLINSVTIDASDWLAERFTLSQATTVSAISAYLMSIDAGNDLGKSVTLAVYADGASTSGPAVDWNADNQGQLFHTSLTFNGDGWNSATNLNWSLNSGRYWFAIEADGNGPSGLQLPTGTPQPAELVAYYSGGAAYATVGASDSFGLQVSSVPEPASIPLALAGVGVLALMARRREA